MGEPAARIRYQRTGTGWVARARHDRRDVIAHARTLASARVEILKRTGFAATRDEIDLPEICTRAIQEARGARREAADANARSRETMRRAALVLADHGLSYRDAAYALGISHSRVQQLLGKDPTADDD